MQLVNDGAIWVDVRSMEKHKKNGFGDSQNFPLDTLRIQMNKLNIESNYIVYCDNGARSLIAAYLLMKQGYSVSYLQGGLVNYKPQNTMHAYDVREQEAAPDYTSHHGNTEKMLLDLFHQPDNEQSSGALKTIITSLIQQLEQALKDKVEAEVARSLAEQKLEAFMRGQVVNLVQCGSGKQPPALNLDTFNNR